MSIYQEFLEREVNRLTAGAKDWQAKFESEYRKHQGTDMELRQAQFELERMKSKSDWYKHQAVMLSEYLDEIKSEYNIGEVAHKLASEAIGKVFMWGGK